MTGFGLMDVSQDSGQRWTRQVRETGRLELLPARWPWALMILVAIMSVLAGIGMYGDAGTSDVQRIIGVIVMIGGTIGIPVAVRTFMNAKEPVVIDQLGIQLPSRPPIPWFEVRGTNVYSYGRNTHSVMIMVSDEFLSRFHSGTNPLVRLFSIVNRGITRVPAIYLPTTINVDPAAFAVWLARAAGVQPPFDQDSRGSS